MYSDTMKGYFNMEKEEFAKYYRFFRGNKCFYESGCSGSKFDLSKDLPIGYNLVSVSCSNDGWGVVTTIELYNPTEQIKCIVDITQL